MSTDSAGKGVRRLRVGKYQILTHIATGGMGAVYKALDTEAGREVALKVLPPETASKPVLVERFRREAGHAAKLDHENIARVYEWGEVNGIYFMALEFVDGIDLYDYISRKGKLSVRRSRQIIIQAVKALEHLFKAGIVHRDIKPSNFLVARKGGRPVIKLIDLGLSRELKDEEYRLTRASYTLGTVDYMAPEQARDSGSADVRSDIYSLGCTWYHMLAGAPPFPNGSLTERIYQHIEVEPPDICEVNPAVPAHVAAILKRMLAKDPADRYQTPAALLRELEPQAPAVALDRELLASLALADDEEAESRPGRRWFRAGQDTREIAAAKTHPILSIRRHWWLWVAAWAVLVGALALVLVLLMRKRHDGLSPDQAAPPVGSALKEPAKRPKRP